MKMHSVNYVDENTQLISEFFPNCVTEIRNQDGDVRLAIDFELLKQELSNSLISQSQERYQINWPGKKNALLAANSPIAKTLRPNANLSLDFDSTKNIIIEGDNLDALKLLQETYLGQVKMIYIDPPYNTGNDFIYEDDFSENAEEYLQRSNQKTDAGTKLVANQESNGRFHSDWLSMIYSRLKLARNLLRDDGVIFISIDDNELANLRRICDEIFGEQNFVAQIEWQKRYTRSNNTDGFTTVIEHILCFGKSEFKPFLLERTDEANSRYLNPDNDPRGPWKAMPFTSQASPGQRPNLCYEIENPFTKEVLVPKRKAWRSSKEVFEKYQSENLVWWGIDGTASSPSIKKFLAEARSGMTPTNFWSHEFAGNTDVANREIKELFTESVFDTPKPTLLIKRMLELSTEGSDIVLDFFAGSGTSAQAVMQANSDDSGNRRFILVQVPHECDQRTEAYKAGYKTISDICVERVRRAGNKIKKESELIGADLDVGFRLLKVDSSNMSDVYYNPDAVSQDLLSDQADNVKTDRTPEDLLFQVLLDWGVDLSLPVQKKSIHGKDVYFVDQNALAACFDSKGGVDEEFVKELAKKQPLRVVFRDAGFKSDSVKINVEQIFKLVSPSTEVKCI